MSKKHLDRRVLFKVLDQNFSLEEIRILIFFLEMDFDEMIGSTKRMIIQQLITHCERRDMLEKLAEEMVNQRSDVEAKLDSEASLDRHVSPSHKKRRFYSKAFKRVALDLWASSNEPAAVIERELGITRGLLSAWKHKARDKLLMAKIEAQRKDRNGRDVIWLSTEFKLVGQGIEIPVRVVKPVDLHAGAKNYLSDDVASHSQFHAKVLTRCRFYTILVCEQFVFEKH
ncbi:MAG: hypothetical protein AAF633_19525 [Chloroflexota bacterium]